MRVGLYTRASTVDQNCEAQHRELEQYSRERGWVVVEHYSDTMSGAKASRPELDRLLGDARQRKFQAVLVWKLDRFGRSVLDLLSKIKELEVCGVRFIATTQGIDTDASNPMSRFQLHMLSAVAEFERELIRERVQSGRQRYRQDFEAGKVGKTVHSRSGKDLPPHRPKKVFDRQAVLKLRAKGVSLRGIAKRLKLGFGTVSRTIQEAGPIPNPSPGPGE
jgi:DNA invertase Pin-like site-specific DNA recombinase